MSFHSIDTKILVLQLTDSKTGYHTFSTVEKGGPIVVTKNEESGKLMMDEALDVAMSVRNLQFFDDISNLTKSPIRRNRTGRSAERIEYIKLQTA